MSKIHNLLYESTTSAANSQGRPDLLALTRAVNALIYTDLVAVQPTSQPTATLFGLRYTNPNKDMTAFTTATYYGEVGDRSSIPEVAAGAVTQGQRFKFQDIVFEATKSGSIASADLDGIRQALVDGTIRMQGDTAKTGQYESANAEIADANFTLDRWNMQVGTRKIKTKLTVELLQDLEHNQMDAQGTVEDMLGTMISEDINKDIIQKLFTVSKRFKIAGVNDSGIVDLTASTLPSVDVARSIYHYVCEMSAAIQKNTSFLASFVLCSSRVKAYLEASGFVNHSDNDLSDGVTRSGLEVYTDTNALIDYVVVGSVITQDEMDKVGSLFFAPFTESDEAGSVYVVNDVNSLQPGIMLMTRYALGVNPYATAEGKDSEQLTAADDWNNLVGRSDMSYLMGFKLPELTIAK